MSKTTAPFRTVGLALLCIVIATLAGCRRADVRTFTVSVPGLTQENKSVVEQALAKYNGIEKDSYVWDFAKKTLTLRYDSMQIAQTNIRMAIAGKGIEVDFPSNTTGRAGH